MEGTRWRLPALLTALALLGLPLSGCGEEEAPAEVPPAPVRTDSFAPVTDTVAYEMSPRQVRTVVDRCRAAAGSLESSEVIGACVATAVVEKGERVSACPADGVCGYFGNDGRSVGFRIADNRADEPLCRDYPEVCDTHEIPITPDNTAELSRVFGTGETEPSPSEQTPEVEPTDGAPTGESTAGGEDTTGEDTTEEGTDGHDDPAGEPPGARADPAVEPS